MISVVFVCRSTLPPMLTTSLPTLAATASLAFPYEPATRLVPLSAKAEARLAEVLRQPKVGFVGILSNAPKSKSLVDFVQETVDAIDVPWLRESSKGEYLPVKTQTVDVSVGLKNKS